MVNLYVLFVCDCASVRCFQSLCTTLYSEEFRHCCISVLAGGGMKQGSEGGSEESEDYLSAPEDRGTPGLPLPPQGAIPPPPLTHVSAYIKSEDKGVALPPTTSPPNHVGVPQAPTLNHAPYIKPESRGVSLPPTTCSVSQHHPIQGTQQALHPLASSLAANQNRLKSPSLGQSPPLMHHVASSVMTSSGIMTSPANSMTSSGQSSPSGGYHTPTLPVHSTNGSAGYMRSLGEPGAGGMTLPLLSPSVPQVCSNSNTYTTQGPYSSNSAPKLTHL